MAGGDILVWLAKLFGGAAIKDHLNRRGLKGELRSLKRALQDSQNRRDELQEAERIARALARQRDEHFQEIVKLRVENLGLRQEIEQLKQADAGGQ